MLPSELALVTRDPALPGLAVLLDDAQLLGWLRGSGPVDRVERRYVRYKPGTSCTLGMRIHAAGEVRGGFVTAYDEGSAPKLHKTVGSAADGSVLAVDASRRLVAATLDADRDLPALRPLLDPARRTKVVRRLLGSRGDVGQLRTLSSKPQRRWVGLVDLGAGRQVVLRAYRPERTAEAVEGIRALAGGGRPRTPELLGVDAGLGLVALEHLPGRALDGRLTEGDAARRAELSAAGEALAHLHLRPPVDLPVRAVVDSVGLSVDALVDLLPGLGPRLDVLRRRLVDRLADDVPSVCVLHGDFSADQVVLGAGGEVGLIDLDAAHRGHPAADLACAAAALAAATVAGLSDPATEAPRLRALHRGYASVRPLPPAAVLAASTSALLLRRAVEPFRTCADDWPTRVGALVARAEAALEGAEVDAPLPAVAT